MADLPPLLPDIEEWTDEYLIEFYGTKIRDHARLVAERDSLVRSVQSTQATLARLLDEIEQRGLDYRLDPYPRRGDGRGPGS